MRVLRCFALITLALIKSTGFAQQVAKSADTPSLDDQYVSGADSQVQTGVPQGKIFRFTLNHTRAFPETSRAITVYVPAQYTGDKPACVYIGLDGLVLKAPVVFDNLINRHEMPVTIGIGVSPGTVESATPGNPRFNRSFEFDTLNDNLARFLVEEVLPDVERRRTPDGLPILLSKDPNDRAAGGASTGGIGAFTLAWERPDLFRRVFTAIGTFVGMRGGDRYAVLVRKVEPKPIRIFMQDGSNDEWMGGPEVGDWWMSNQTLERALRFAGYQVEHVWGEGTHSGEHPTAVFPDAMRWLWQGWPQPITAGESQNTFLRDILLPGEGWQIVTGDYQSAGPLAVTPRGEIVFRDIAGERNWKITADGRPQEYSTIKRPYAGMAFEGDGRSYITDISNSRIVAVTTEGRTFTIAKGIRGLDLTVSYKGNVYVTEPGQSDLESGNVWLIKPNGSRLQLDSHLSYPSGIALSPDGSWLAVAEKKTHWGYSYRVQADGSVQGKQRFYWFHIPDNADDSGAGSWVMDREGRLYSATRVGVQVFDRNGRVRAILPVPGGELHGLVLGGNNFDTLYVSSSDHKLYRRKLKIFGVPSWSAPIQLPKWSAG